MQASQFDQTMQTPGADSVTAKRNDKRTTYTKLEVERGTYLGYRLYLNVHNPEKNVWKTAAITITSDTVPALARRCPSARLLCMRFDCLMFAAVGIR